MSLFRYLVPLLLLTSCLSHAAEAPLCPVPPVSEPELLAGDNPNIVVTADKAQINQDTLAFFSGNVDIQSRDAQIHAQQATYNKREQFLGATGDIRYRDRQIEVTSDDLFLDADSGRLNLRQTQYRLSAYPGRGAAGSIGINQREGIVLDDVTFTTCPAGQEDWALKAGSLELSPGKIWGEAKHTRLYIADVPVLYLPYFSFPVTDRRQSGLLFPKFTSSDRVGLSYEQPYYWNIAPNMDLTLSPRVMTDRGVQLKTEFRYLSRKHQGQLNLEYLDNDRRFELNEARYAYRLSHLSQLSENWLFSADINDISDDNYIVDLGSDFYSRADTHLYQTLKLDYFSETLSLNMQLRDFEIIGDHPESYRTLPEIKLNYQVPFGSVAHFGLHSELAYFDSPDPGKHAASRFHIAPTLSLPLSNEWGELLGEVSVLHTRYHQDVAADSTLAKNTSRTLGKARLYGAINFERTLNFSGQSLTQTLEPKMQYLYTSYEDQSEIGLYDTNRLLNDYDGLFRGQSFAGLDRISDANHLTVGLTSRLMDESESELLRASIGQIFYLQTPEMGNAQQNSDRSALAGELDWRINNHWSLQTELQLGAEDQAMERSSMSLNYQPSASKLLQATYRYVENIGNEEIEQAGFTVAWPLAKRWQWVARWYHDLTQHRSIETYTGLQYDSCCWSIRLVAQRYLSNRFDALGHQNTNEFESGISLQFEFKGMGSSDSARSLLDEGLFGYRQPYFVNQ
ncbi:LPS-assembly protein LptD [Saliniradius amylolyticus]|uniref:LPS-assembly protein LptD n=1 Tax=Saliniradius amylolyticus TaxID=2183582 RepID=A0A2S2DZZ2_9ALTE|nr:LPS assembly protein LptD [Saliniradius amylolyticus]AWL10946.1 LPS-assembly protein LptD [Saliniradius amylolyticus]